MVGGEAIRLLCGVYAFVLFTVVIDIWKEMWVDVSVQLPRARSVR